MSAQSKAQQRFMGMVHAFKKGDMADASSDVKHAAGSMSDADTEKFASTKHTGLPDKVKGESMFGQVVGQYNEYGNTLRQSFSMREMAEKLMEIAEFAEQTLTNETAGGDWYDTHTIRRNIKEMKSYVKEFYKLAEEYDTIRTRATALYDDMGRVLERYFEVTGYDTDNDMEDDLVAGNATKDPTAGDSTNIPSPTEPPEDEDVMRKKRIKERLLSLARHKLRGEQLVTFDTLPEDKQVRAAWRIIN